MSDETIIHEWLKTISADVPEVPVETTNRLSRLLQGFQLQSDRDGDDEPYPKLYKTAVQNGLVPELTHAVAALLERWLNDEWAPSLKERGKFNLLGLCAEIADGEHLGDSLKSIEARKLVAGMEYQWFRSISLDNTLQQAILRNPAKQTFEAECGTATAYPDLKKFSP